MQQSAGGSGRHSVACKLGHAKAAALAPVHPILGFGKQSDRRRNALKPAFEPGKTASQRPIPDMVDAPDARRPLRPTHRTGASSNEFANVATQAVALPRMGRQSAPRSENGMALKTNKRLGLNHRWQRRKTKRMAGSAAGGRVSAWVISGDLQDATTDRQPGLRCR